MARRPNRRPDSDGGPSAAPEAADAKREPPVVATDTGDATARDGATAVSGYTGPARETASPVEVSHTGGATASEGGLANTGYLAIYKFTLVLRTARGTAAVLLGVLLTVWLLFVVSPSPGTITPGDDAGGGTPQPDQETHPPAQTGDPLNTATSQLGDANMDVRLDGIASLRQIMKQSPRDQPKVVRLLTDHIRNRGDEFTQRDRPEGDAERAAEDVVAAAKAIGARDTKYGGVEHLEMDNIHLRQAPLRGVNLSGAKLRGTDLRGANLSGADLSGADLRGANLYEANLYGARLVKADLTNADKTRVGLERADLTGVKGLPPGFPENS